MLPKHGLSRTAEYRSWQTMRLRCTNPSNKAFPSYGGRGIWVCSRWLASPEHFLEDMGPKPSPDYEIDRINNDAGYTCGHCEDCKARGAASNCRWTTRVENDRNRRSSRMLTFRGETLSMVAWCERLGLSYCAVAKRLQSGSSVEDALSAPVRPKAKNGHAKVEPRTKPRMKYPVEVVATMRQEAANGATRAELARRYGMSKKYAGKILSGERRGASERRAAA